MTKKNKRIFSSKRVALTQITQKQFFIHSVNTLVCDQLEIEEIIFARLKLNKARKF